MMLLSLAIVCFCLNIVLINFQMSIMLKRVDSLEKQVQRLQHVVIS